MKTCFKCNRSLIRSEFYAHPQMGDGLLGKCKDCTKSDSKARIAMVRKDPNWVKMEASRCRRKAARYRAAGVTFPQSSESKKRWAQRNQHKVRAHIASSNAVRCGKLIPLSLCEDCGKKTKLQKHHADYSKPLSVEWLCTKCHGKRHWKT